MEKLNSLVIYAVYLVLHLDLDWARKCCIVICIVIVNATLVAQRRIDRRSHGRFSIEKLFLKISQNSQENTCASSCEFSEIWKTTFFTKHFWVTASVFKTISNIYDRTFFTEAVAQRCSLKRCSKKFRKIHRKTPVQEPLFNKVAGLSEISKNTFS